MLIIAVKTFEFDGKLDGTLCKSLTWGNSNKKLGWASGIDSESVIWDGGSWNPWGKSSMFEGGAKIHRLSKGFLSFSQAFALNWIDLEIESI